MPWETDLSESLKKRIDPSSWEGSKDLAITSAVLVPIAYNSDRRRHEILLTKRSMLVETHKGQISFPGGRLDAGDLSLLHAATREAHEEIGLHPDSVKILGALSPVSTRFSMTIYPWVGRLDTPYAFRINPHEVEKIIILPVEQLLTEGLQEATVELGAGIKVKSTAIWTENELVWGATAKILEDLRTFLLPLKF